MHWFFRIARPILSIPLIALAVACLLIMPLSATSAQVRPGSVLPAGALSRAESGPFLSEAATVIQITETGLTPADLSIAVGDDVVWENQTAQIQTVQSGVPGMVFLPLLLSGQDGPYVRNSPLLPQTDFRGTLQPGERLTVTFALEGEYAYYLVNRPRIRGRISVAPKSDPNPGPDVPPLENGTTTDLGASIEFLYSGSSPIQTGVLTDTIESRRVAVLRGQVFDGDRVPLADVTITILDHPEFGQTRSRSDGQFDMAVNGGTPYRVSYSLQGHMPVQRHVVVPQRDFVWLPDVVMLDFDSRVTTIDLTETADHQVAQGSPITDTDGSRQATLVFAPGTQASMLVKQNGRMVQQPLSTINVRATEYTVGDAGPNAMPADLPAQSGYTYAVELSVDEAVAAGATEVTFDRPVAFYLENFLGFPVGGIVPSGYYDRVQGEWVAVPNGRVVKVISESGGVANLDIDGTGLANSDQELVDLGVTDGERTQLATLYDPGQSLWRVPVTHFTPWDHNWPYGPPIDAETFLQLCQAEGGSASDCSEQLEDLLDNPCNSRGSIIECENQVLRESVNLLGTPYSLNYASDRVPGRIDPLTIPLSVGTVPDSLKRIDLEILVAGQRIQRTFAPAPNLQETFLWDGKDAYSRTVQGSVPVQVRVGYNYDLVYMEPSEFQQSFGRFSDSGATVDAQRGRGDFTFWNVSTDELRRMDARTIGLGGWTLSAHHLYDPVGHILYRGDGTRRSAEALPDIIETVGGTGTSGFSGDGGPATEADLGLPLGIAFGPDGALYFADYVNARIRRIDSSGIITTVAGNGKPGSHGDGGPALDAALASPVGIAFGPDGSLYVAHLSRIRRIDSSGIITTVAGTGLIGSDGDGGPATEAKIRVTDVAVGADGSIYISEEGSHRVRRVGPDGMISTVAGINGNGGPGANGVQGPQSRLNAPYGLGIGPDGSLYIADMLNFRIRKVSPDGIITSVAGNGRCCFDGDGGLATQATLGQPRDVYVMSDGGFYITEFTHKINGGRIRYVSPDGIITTVAGSGARGGTGDNGPALQAALNNVPSFVAVGPDNLLYLSDSQNRRLRRVGPVFAGFSGVAFLIPSEDGTELFEFDPFGRHLRTIDALTGAVRYGFTYTDLGYLNSVRDVNGLLTTIERDADGVVRAIVGPYGHRTQLIADESGFLAQILDPAAQQFQLKYNEGGLLTSLINPRGQESIMSYDASGNLLQDQDAGDGSTSLSRINTNDGYAVSRVSALDRTTTFSVTRLSTGGQLRIVTLPGGEQTRSTVAGDGTRTTHFADGMVTISELGPDPRLGMQAPVPIRLTLASPAGITGTITTQRLVEMTDPTDFLSLQTLTEIVVRNGQPFTKTYDAATRTHLETSPEGRQTTTHLDELGRVRQVQRAGLAPVVFEYDSQGNLATSRVGTGDNQRVTTFSYNSQGVPASTVDPAGNQVGFTYDLAGRVTEQSLPGSRSISYAYDPNDNMTSVTPPGRSPHLFTYTAVDLQSAYAPSSEIPVADQTRYAFNSDRQPTRILRPDDGAVDFSYDSAGRLAAMQTPQGAYAYGYAGTGGKLVSLATPQGITLALGYDGVLLISQRWSGPVAGEVAYAYNTDFRPAEQTVNGQFTVSLSYDGDGLLVQAGDLHLLRNDLHGMVMEMSLDGLTDHFAYSGFADLMATESRFGAELLRSFAYEHNALGQITVITETVGVTTQVLRYTYAPAGGLTRVERNGAEVASYTYDQNGNRLAAVDATGAATAGIDALDRMVQYGDLDLVYNPNGELSERRSGAGTTTYAYDAFGNLTGVTLATGTQITYLLDAYGRRVGKLVDGGMAQGFLYRSGSDPGSTGAAGPPNANLAPVAELEADGKILSLFVYASRGHVPDYMVRSGRTLRIFSDHLGSVRMVVDAASGEIMQEMDYDAFGQILRDTNPGFQPFGFAGGLHDRDTGLTHFGAREYDSLLGRWITPDPLLFAGGDTNLYAYVLNDPVNWIDPSGLAWYEYFEWLEPVGNFSAGFGDTVTTVPFTDFSFTRATRKALDVDDQVDRCSGLFRLGNGVGFVANLAKSAANVNNLYKWYKAPLYRQAPIPTVPNFFPGVRNIPSRTLYGYP